MKRFLRIILGLIVLGGTAYLFRQPIQTRLPTSAKPVFAQVSNFVGGIIEELRGTFAPCSSPITYSLGTFDTRFGISKKYFLSALSDAEAVWGKPLGKQLFTYAPSAGYLKINLIYDYRQQATGKLQSLGIAVQDDKASYDSLEAKYAGLKIQYLAAKADFESWLEAFDEKQTAYQQQVSYWNGKGGAPRAEYDRLQSDRLALETASAELQTRQAQINEMVEEINALVAVLNRLANSLNLAVAKYNTIGASRGESFEEGLYQSGAAGAEIDIYEFSSRDKLVRVLAHELGHALGLEHVSDPKAIMYQFNQGANEALTKADLSALKARCGAK